MREATYCVVRWKNHLAHRGFPAHEVYREPIEHDESRRVVEKQLTFREAWALCQELNGSVAVQ